MDKNSIIGFGLLAALLMGYLFFNQKQQEKLQAQHTLDSIANIKLHPELLLKDSANKATGALAVVDSTALKLQAAASENTLENDDVKITFSSLGAQPTKVLLKKFTTATKHPLYVYNTGQNSFDFTYKTTSGAMVHTKTTNFIATPSANSISYTLPNGISINYTLPATGFMLDMAIKGNNTIDANQAIALNWNSTAPQTEYNAANELQYNQYGYNETKDGFDYFTIRKEDKKELKDGVKWLDFRQHYFTTILLSETKDFTTASIATHPIPSTDTSNTILAKLDANLSLPAAQDLQFKLYSGPLDYKILKSYNKDLEEIIPLGYGLMTFVKYINKWAIMPIFNALCKLTINYGIVILLLTLIVRLLMAPVTYKSYVSSAKMKVLKPEIDELKAKHGADQQAFSVAQMALFRSAGVNPMGGCLPSLVQLPIFFALLSFFPNAIQLRQQPFLWAKDLSTFDTIYNLPFSIPAYGNHISLFTLLFVATSLAMALYNQNMTPTDVNNPAMKYLPFIMPIMFLGIFNKLPASLTFYYFVSNLVTLIIQYVIQNYIIDNDKIHAQLQENKNKPPKENKLMQRMQEMQQQNAERMKKVNNTKK